MNANSLKPFDDKKYVSEAEALKWVESLPKPEKDGSGKVIPPEVKPNVPETENLDLESRIIQLDNLPANNGNKKTQEQWLEYWKNINDGRIFASMPDYYQAFKQLKEKVEHGSAQEKSLANKIIEGLREDFDWPSKNNWLISSTRIEYQPNKEDAKIIHHYNCSDKSRIQENNLFIPEYSGIIIADVLNNIKGLAYMQALLRTKDNEEAIMQNLEFISNKPRGEIKIWTPDQAGRRSYPNRASGLDCNFGVFHVYGNNSIGYNGRSRGVLVGPR